jgi:hypothetical protein
MSDSEGKPPKPNATVFGYSGFGAGGSADQQPPATPPPPAEATPPAAATPPATPPPFATPPPPSGAWPSAAASPAGDRDEPAAAWPQTDARPQPPGTPPPPYGSAAPEPSPIGYAPYGAPYGAGQVPAGSPYAGAETAAGAGPYAAPGGGPLGGVPGGPAAMCGVHPETPAVGLCPRCGAYMCQWCQRINDFGEVLCATCMERVGYGTPIPWDRREELGTFQAWWQTFRESMMKPDDFFARAAHGLPSNPPFLFAMICGWLAQIGSSVISLAMNERPGMIIINFFMVPVGVLLSVYVGGGIAHLFAKMFGGTGNYAMTCRCWGYCHSAGALGLVPGLGTLAGAVWAIVLEIYAVKHAQRISGGKAAAAVLLPVGILLALCCVGLAIVGAAAAAAFSGSRGSF